MTPGLDQVFVLVGQRVVPFVAFEVGNFFAHDATVLAGVLGDHVERCAACP